MRSDRATFGLCALLLAIGMMAGCASTEDSASGGAGKDCAEQCEIVPQQSYDECMVTCEAEL